MTPSAAAKGTSRLFPFDSAARILAAMETSLSPAEELPALYRAILDGIAELERLGQRREAGLVRSEATRVYSSSWDASGLRRLDQLRRHVERVVSGVEHPRTARGHPWRPFRRSFRARAIQAPSIPTPRHEPA